MNIQKLKSGSYRIRMMENGKSYALTVPYKPSVNEAYKLIREKIDNPTGKYDTMTFEEASERYIEVKYNVLSPSTIKGYRSVLKAIPDYFKGMLLKDIDTDEVQKVLNDYSLNHSPKSVRNVSGFISAVFKHFKNDAKFHTTLPQKVVKKAYIPSEGDVKRLLEYAKDTEYYIPLCLSSLSLRRSEWSALTIDDVEGNVIHITKAKVKNDKNEWIIKPILKNDTSFRDIYISDELAEAIRDKGSIFNYNPGSIEKFMRKACKDLGIEYFSVHKLRHFFASYCNGKFTDKQIMAMGGWKTDTVFKTIYTHAMEEEKAKQDMANQISSFF